MNNRERQIRRARQLISDERLIAFFDAAEANDYFDVMAVKLIAEALGSGKSLDELFYDGGEYGYLLSAKRLSQTDFHIEFGCQAGPLAGDGGEWVVSFDGDRVKSITGGGSWIS